MKAIFEVKRCKRSVTQGEAVVYLNDVEVASFGDEYAVDGVHGDVFYPKEDGILQWGSINPDETFIMAVLLPCETRRKYYPGEVEKMECRIKQILQGGMSDGKK